VGTFTMLFLWFISVERAIKRKKISGSSANSLAKVRYAKGEISKAEFEEKTNN
jgi:uncharacterized membrane protein